MLHDICTQILKFILQISLTHDLLHGNILKVNI